MKGVQLIVGQSFALTLGHITLILILAVALMTVLMGIQKMEERDAHLLPFVIQLAPTLVPVPMLLHSVRLAPRLFPPTCLMIH
jgi:hypothetical protein